MAFDAVLQDFTVQTLYYNLLLTEFPNEKLPYFKPLSEDIYDLEFVWSNSTNILTFDYEIKISEIQKSAFDMNDYDLFSSSFNDIIKVNITFDNCGIGSVRFDFDVIKGVKTDDLIKLIDKSCTLVDSYLFVKIKKNLAKTDIETELLKDHMVYSVVSSVIESPVSYPKEEIFGIAWKYSDYKSANDQIVDKIISDDVSLQKNDTLIVTKQSTFMIFEDVGKDYVESRLIAIEMFWRQKLLLKKLDYKIIKLFKCINDKKTKENLELLIEKIKLSQISMHSDLEAYRNSILSVTDSFSMLFRKLNEVFELDTHFNFVQSKLNACDNIYEGLHDEKRNKLMENIQWIVIGVGLANIITIVLLELIK